MVARLTDVMKAPILDQYTGPVLFDGRAAAQIRAAAIESEAATTTVMWLADLFDAPAGDERAAALQRLALPIVKYWTCKRLPGFVGEALECLGGAGYVEESILALPVIYINGGRRGFIVGLHPNDLARVLNPVPVRVAVAPVPRAVPARYVPATARAAA